MNNLSYDETFCKGRVNPLEQAKAYIYSIDFSQIIEKLVKYGGWSSHEATTTCQLYRNFLFLNKKYPEFGALPPSEDIDEFWHSHILDTKKYHIDCIAIFGEYFHHYPYLGIDEKTTMKDLYQAFERTQQLHFQEFGEYIYAVRKGKLSHFFRNLLN